MELASIRLLPVPPTSHCMLLGNSEGVEMEVDVGRE